jgi:hypothetical protein
MISLKKLLTKSRLPEVPPPRAGTYGELAEKFGIDLEELSRVAAVADSEAEAVALWMVKKKKTRVGRAELGALLALLDFVRSEEEKWFKGDEEKAYFLEENERNTTKI